ncbi:hypothetical protein ACJ73_07616 [Blastomyces percursus]|uniref:Uncharacterized protein n=1 Tax=Blastomyces percursus TaxID=1658174 RepID=A0A1J9PXJ5_9EURO|nr:hypothetical protein ACJ73_07616 [Blastomyces percursus]
MAPGAQTRIVTARERERYERGEGKETKGGKTKRGAPASSSGRANRGPAANEPLLASSERHAGTAALLRPR